MRTNQCIWAQLYIERTENPSCNPFPIKNLADKFTVSELMEEVHAKKSRSLEYYDASDLEAYITIPCNEESKLDSWAFIPINTTGPNPLIIVAPSKAPSTLLLWQNTTVPMIELGIRQTITKT